MTLEGTEPQRVLVTGGAGFIGSHLVESLIAKGHGVVAIDDLSTGRLENIRHLLDHPRFRFEHASVTDAPVLDRLVSGTRVVVHLAAAVGVNLIVDRPVHTIETNVSGTEAVLKSAARFGRRTLIASSSEVYGKGSRVPFAEDDDVLLGATRKSRWAYAATKMIDEFLAFAYAQERGLPVVVFRLFNTVGRRQSGQYGMVLPRFIDSAMAGRPIDVYGDGTQTRCFCDVADVVRAIVGLIAHPGATGEVFNIGSREEITVLDLAKKVRTLLGSSSEIRLVPYSEAYPPGFEDMKRRLPDTSRIERLLGWKPEYTLDEIVSRIRDSVRGVGV